MRGLAAGEVLSAWESGRGLGRLERPLAALGAWMPDRPPDQVARLPVGDRDALLLQLHAATFGPSLQGLARCPTCGESVEFEVAVDELPAAPAQETLSGTRRLEKDGYVVDYRPPDTMDLIAVSAAPDAESARTQLMVRCASVVAAPGGALEAGMPDAVMSALDEEIARQQPASDIDIVLSCPDCATSWSTTLDVGYFVWEEISAEARRLVFEVDRLARGYGWREADILAMTSARRRTYLEMVE
jgi:hypothetical protein